MATQSLLNTSTASLTHLLVEASLQFSEDIYRRTINTSPWLKLIKQGSWPDEMGDTISVITYERTLPSTVNSWDNINSDSTSFAVPNATQVTLAQTIRTYGIKHTAIESQPITVNDGRMSFRVTEQIKAVYDNLVENVAWLWIQRYRDEFRRLAASKVIAGPTTGSATGALYRVTTEDYPEGLTTSGTGGVSNGVGILTQGLLNKLYMELIRDGAGNRPMGMENGRPIFTLVCSPENSDALIRLNASSRDDFRYSSSVSELLKPMGVERSYRGFYHLIDTTCPRYNYVPAAPSITTALVDLTVDSRVSTANKIALVTLVGANSLDNLRVGQKFAFTTATSNQGGSITGGVILEKSAASGAGTFYCTYTSATAPTGVGTSPTWVTYNRAGSTATQCFCEVPFYIIDSTGYTVGTGVVSTAKRYIVNPEYYNAEFEESFIVHPEVMEALIPAPISSFGSGTKFNPVNYRGDFKFLNIPHRVDNPDGNWGYYRGVLASGSKPVRPQYGIAIMTKRIPDVGLYQDVPSMTTAPYYESVGAGLSTDVSD